MAVVFEGVSNAFRDLICSRTEEAETELYTQPSLGVYTSSPVACMRTPPTQRSEFSFSLPWLITPGKVWPPAVSTDPTIDASLVQPYNHLRTKLCSALPTGSFFRLQRLHFSLQESAPILLPDPAWPRNAVFLEGWVLTHQTESFDLKPDVLPLRLHIRRRGNQSTRWMWGGASQPRCWWSLPWIVVGLLLKCLLKSRDVGLKR